MTEPAKNFDYIEEAHVTASDKYYGDRIPLSYFAHVVGQAIDALSKLDEIKKVLFYGREIPMPQAAGNGNAATLAKLPDWLAVDASEVAQRNAINIIHGIIGKATEAGELLETLAATANNGATFDDVNAIEEVGDGFWYDALVLRALGSNFGEAQRVNIAKLRHRFPNAFTEYDANNRDLFGEREILEGDEAPAAVAGDNV